MKSRKEQIFQENLVIPEIVERKAEEAFEVIRMERIEKMEEKKQKNSGDLMMRNKKKAAIGIAACAALLLAAGSIGLSGREDAGTMNPRQVAEGKDVFQSAADMFTMKVYAAETPDAGDSGYVTLEQGKAVPLSLDGDIGYVLCGSEDGSISYCISTHFLCEGEDIESITYSINEGAFQIVEPKDSTIVTLSEKYDGEINTGAIGGEDNEETGEILSVTNLYKSFTVSYDNQINDQTWINICGNTDERWDEVFGQDKTLEEEVNGIEKIMKDVIITCNVQYTDGSTSEAQVLIGGGITKPEETGASEKAEPYATFVFQMQ